MISSAMLGLQVIVNMTVLNGMGVTGKLDAEPRWIPDASGAGNHVDIQFSYSSVLWPWSGYLVLYITVLPSGANVRGTVRNPPPPPPNPSLNHYHHHQTRNPTTECRCHRSLQHRNGWYLTRFTFVTPPGDREDRVLCDIPAIPW